VILSVSGHVNTRYSDGVAGGFAVEGTDASGDAAKADTRADEVPDPDVSVGEAWHNTSFILARVRSLI
jgi:hypothetical protein